MFENFETVRILPEMREQNISIEEEFANIIERYDDFCQTNHIYINHLALATQFQLSKKNDERFYYNQEWKQSLSNLIKIIDKENLSLIVIDIKPIEKEIYENYRDFDFFMEYIESILRPYGFSLYEYWWILDDNFSKLVFIGDTDDGFAVKHCKEKDILYETTITEIVPTNPIEEKEKYLNKNE